MDLLVSDSEISLGESVLLTWNATGADTCVASQGWSGVRGFTGSESVTPQESTTFALSCTNEANQASDAVTVTVLMPEPEPTLSLTASMERIAHGGSTVLQWTSANTTDCSASSGWTGAKETIGNEVVTPTATTTYTLSCVGPGGSTGDSVTVTVQYPLPEVLFEASAEQIQQGATTTLTWSSTFATTCEARNGWSGTKNLAGNEVVSPVATTTFELTCYGERGATTKSVVIGVTPIEVEKPVVIMNVEPNEIEEGDEAKISWSSVHADTCMASGDWSGIRSLVGEENVTPTKTSTYTLTCTAVGGEDQSTLVVSVTPANLAKHVVLSEVYYDVDATHGTESHEWVELHNPTLSPVSLAGWSILDGSGSVDTIPSGVIIGAGSYVILAATTTLPNYWTFPAGVLIVNFGSPIGNGLSNDGDAVTLRDTSLLAVDALSWGNNTSVFVNSITDVAEGSSIARVPVSVDTDTASDWIEDTTPSPGS